MTLPPPSTFIPPQSGLPVLSSAGRGWTEIHCELRRVEAGLHRIPGSSWHRLGVHFGPAVNADCRCDGIRQRRVQSQGDADLVPAGLAGEWADDRTCTILRIALSPALVARVADESDAQGHGASLRPRLQLRDERLMHLASALKAELEASAPSGRLYAEGLGTAIAARLAAAGKPGLRSPGGNLSSRQRRILVDYIEANLDRELGLAELAAVAALGLSQLKLLFRRTTGRTVHAYVVERRIERARALLAEGSAIAEAAAAAGFAHQSHLAHWMKRHLGVTPREFLRSR